MYFMGVCAIFEKFLVAKFHFFRSIFNAGLDIGMGTLVGKNRAVVAPLFKRKGAGLAKRHKFPWVLIATKEVKEHVVLLLV